MKNILYIFVNVNQHQKIMDKLLQNFQAQADALNLNIERALVNKMNEMNIAAISLYSNHASDSTLRVDDTIAVYIDEENETYDATNIIGIVPTYESILFIMDNDSLTSEDMEPLRNAGIVCNDATDTSFTISDMEILAYENGIDATDIINKQSALLSIYRVVSEIIEKHLKNKPLQRDMFFT